MGKDPLQNIRDRLADLNKNYDLGFSEEDLDETIFRATELANKDVDNFSEVHAENFTENTWNILPESHPAMRYPNTLRN